MTTQFNWNSNEEFEELAEQFSVRRQGIGHLVKMMLGEG
jgi:hypothetical protein